MVEAQNTPTHFVDFFSSFFYYAEKNIFSGCTAAKKVNLYNG